ncbi:ATP-dependent helicase/nuclease subunit A [Bienertia sinuspersici]
MDGSLANRRGYETLTSCGEPDEVEDEDLTSTPKYLVAFTVGYDQRANVDACIKKFSANFTILLFHYDGRTSEWDEFEWSKRAIHVSARKQTKCMMTVRRKMREREVGCGRGRLAVLGDTRGWYAKRFLHPNIVAAYDYIFIWDEDLGVKHFNAEKYINLVKKHGLEISQPGLEPDKGLTWQMTKRRGNSEGETKNGKAPGVGVSYFRLYTIQFPCMPVKERCRREWTMFQDRVAVAEKAHFESLGWPSIIQLAIPH